MLYLKYVGVSPIMNCMFGEFRKGELKKVPGTEVLTDMARKMEKEQPFNWRTIERETHGEANIKTTEKNKLDKSQGRVELETPKKSEKKKTNISYEGGKKL